MSDITITTYEDEVGVDTVGFEITVRDGFAGPAGPAGPAGEPGPPGADSTVPGPEGPEGPAGPAGPPGQDGADVEFGFSATHLQWRYAGDETWIDLVPLTSITGPEGPAGETGPAGATGDAGAPGTPGADGDDGREVEFQKSATHIQWRYVGDVSWTDLVALSELVGPAGSDGADGTDGAPGTPGAAGDSAYEVAVAEGFVGDEAAWLASLVGPAGADGEDGTDGVIPTGIITKLHGPITQAAYDALTPYADTLYVIVS